MGERFDKVAVERRIHRAQGSAAIGELRKLRPDQRTRERGIPDTAKSLFSLTIVARRLCALIGQVGQYSPRHQAVYP